MRKTLWFIILYLSTSLPVYAETSLWKVASDGHVMYVGGTCHVLRPSDYPLPVEFDKAYGQSAVIAFETDIQRMNHPDVLQVLMEEGMYPEGRTLKNALSSRAYNTLKTYCENAGVPFSAVQKMKPWMALLSLLSFELNKLGVSNVGVDAHYYKKAFTDRKPVEALEPVEKQLEVMTSMGKGYENDFVFYSVRDLEKTGEIIGALIAMWKDGDERKLEALFSVQMKKECPKLYKTMLVQRNHDWLPKLEGFLRTPEKELVLVGVAHLVGEDGLITLLKKRGYQVEKF